MLKKHDFSSTKPKPDIRAQMAQILRHLKSDLRHLKISCAIWKDRKSLKNSRHIFCQISRWPLSTTKITLEKVLLLQSPKAIIIIVFSSWKLKYPVKTHICAVFVFCHRYKLFFTGSSFKNLTGSLKFPRVVFEVIHLLNWILTGRKLTIFHWWDKCYRYIFLLFFIPNKYILNKDGYQSPFVPPNMP